MGGGFQPQLTALSPTPPHSVHPLLVHPSRHIVPGASGRWRVREGTSLTATPPTHQWYAVGTLGSASGDSYADGVDRWTVADGLESDGQLLLLRSRYMASLYWTMTTMTTVRTWRKSGGGGVVGGGSGCHVALAQLCLLNAPRSATATSPLPTMLNGLSPRS